MIAGRNFRREEENFSSSSRDLHHEKKVWRLSCWRRDYGGVPRVHSVPLVLFEFGWGIRLWSKSGPNNPNTMGCVSSVFQYGSYTVDESKPHPFSFSIPNFIFCLCYVRACTCFCYVCQEKKVWVPTRGREVTFLDCLQCIPEALTVRDWRKPHDQSHL